MSDSHDPAAGEDAAAERLRAFVARVGTGGQQPRAILDRATAEIFGAFAEVGVQALLLKGAGLAQLLYWPDEERSYVDVDVLVRPRDAAAAGATLAGLGYHNLTAQVGIDDIGGVVHADTWVDKSSSAEFPVQVELHRWFPGAQAAPENVWQALARHCASIDVAGTRIEIPAREAQALQLATHLAQHGPEYAKGVYELTLALERWPKEVWREAASLASVMEALDHFAAGLGLTERGAVLAAELELTDSHELGWEIRNTAARPRGTFFLDALLSSSNLSARLSVIRRALLPSRRWIEHEYHLARRGRLGLGLAYILHVLRAPVWAARAWRFRRRGRRLS